MSTCGTYRHHVCALQQSYINHKLCGYSVYIVYQAKPRFALRTTGKKSQQRVKSLQTKTSELRTTIFL